MLLWSARAPCLLGWLSSNARGVIERFPMTEQVPLIDALRGIGLLQLELLRFALYIASEGPAEFEGEKLVCSMTEPRRRASTLLAMAAGQSTNTVLRMAKLRGIPVRDAYPVARSAIETFVNAAYLLSEADDVSERAIRYVDYAAWKHHNRRVGSGDYSLEVSSDPNAQQTLSAKFPEFNGKGMGTWTFLDVPSRIRRVGELSGKRAGSRLLTAYALIYSLSSEVIHGSPFGVSFFYTGRLAGDVSPEAFREGTVRQLEEILIAVLHAACGYLASFAEVQALGRLGAAEQRVFDRLLDVSTKDASAFPSSSPVSSNDEASDEDT